MQILYILPYAPSSVLPAFKSFFRGLFLFHTLEASGKKSFFPENLQKKTENRHAMQEVKENI